MPRPTASRLKTWHTSSPGRTRRPPPLRGITLMAKRFEELSEREILALAITLEEEDGRIYGEFAEGLRETYPSTAKIFDEMQVEESEHRTSLIELFRKRFGEHIPLLRRH